MPPRGIRLLLVLALLPMATCELLYAFGGHTKVAVKGRPAAIRPTWPKGTGDLINDPQRTNGWESFFSEWPNDVQQFEFNIESTADANRLIETLAAIKTGVKQVRLAPLAEPQALGMLHGLKAGNGIPVVFSIGDQDHVDQWYRQLRQPFGQIRFSAAPVAIPPTLTIFIRNKHITLEELRIPPNVTVEIGTVPFTFHKSNAIEDHEPATTAEQRPTTYTADGTSTPEIDAAVVRIDEFLRQRKSQQE